jgi:hypothetical protein
MFTFTPRKWIVAEIGIIQGIAVRILLTTLFRCRITQLSLESFKVVCSFLFRFFLLFELCELIAESVTRNWRGSP